MVVSTSTKRNMPPPPNLMVFKIPTPEEIYRDFKNDGGRDLNKLATMVVLMRNEQIEKDAKACESSNSETMRQFCSHRRDCVYKSDDFACSVLDNATKSAIVSSLETVVKDPNDMSHAVRSVNKLFAEHRK